LDLLIGVTAVVHNLTIMTRNVRHFGRIPGLVMYTP
jgi:predicted nucleic acid-binding protein